MNVIIHDLEKEQFESLFHNIKEDTHIIADTGIIRNCIGCFGCWIKTPGECVIKDGYDDLGQIFSKADKVIIISKCTYGGYSPFVKNILDRSISYLLPFFKTINNETHHKQRYKKHWQFISYFYGENISPSEIDAAKKLVKANSINFSASDHHVSFYKTIEQLSEEVTIQ